MLSGPTLSPGPAAAQPVNPGDGATANPTPPPTMPAEYGVLTISVLVAKELKNMEWIGKNDVYATLKLTGGTAGRDVTVRTRTLPNAGATACDAIVTKCAAGKFKAGDTVDNVEICRACPAGRFGAANNGSGRCELCPAGKYQPYEGKPSCFGLCPAGTYGSTAGAQSETEGCEACAPGRYQYWALLLVPDVTLLYQ